MSKEEMNLYKRCKNIFKSHGVDMGGGSGGELDIVISLENNGETPVLVKGDYDAIAAKIGHDAIAGLVKYTIESEDMIVHGHYPILNAVRTKTSEEDVIQFIFWSISTAKGLWFYPDGTIEVGRLS